MPNAFDFHNPPFDCLSELEQQAVRQQLDILFFAKGSRLLQPGQPVAELYVLIKGHVRLLDGDDTVAMLGPLDTFDGQSLVAGQGQYGARAEEDMLCYALPRDAVLALTRSNARFGAYFYQEIARRLNALAISPDQAELQSLVMTRISDAYMAPPRWLTADESIQEAARLMKATRSTSVLVQDGERTGIVTTSDLRDAIIRELPPQAPLRDIVSFSLVCIDDDDFLFNALILMARHTIQRVVVRRAGSIVGILEQIDLLSFVSNHSHIIGLQIERAQAIADLQAAAGDLQRLIELLHRTGVKVTHIARLMQELNGKLFARLLQLLAPPALLANSCLLVLGSEGRGEQILKTDQDNALILRDDYHCPDLVAITQQFTATLATMGYPPCAGGIMISNPQWRQPYSTYQDILYRWVWQPNEQDVLNLAIFVDAHPVCGDVRLLQGLRQQLQDLMQDHDGFYASFARAIDAFETPIGLFSQLIADQGSHKNELDLKKGGIFPIVHGVRSLALQYRVAVLNTQQRIAELVVLGRLEEGFAADLKEALAFLQQLKLNSGLEEMRQGRQPDNLVRPHKLSTLERDLLKDSLLVVKKFKALLRHHFKLQGY